MFFVIYSFRSSYLIRFPSLFFFANSFSFLSSTSTMHFIQSRLSSPGSTFSSSSSSSSFCSFFFLPSFFSSSSFSSPSSYFSPFYSSTPYSLFTSSYFSPSICLQVLLHLPPRLPRPFFFYILQLHRLILFYFFFLL